MLADGDTEADVVTLPLTLGVADSVCRAGGEHKGDEAGGGTGRDSGAAADEVNAGPEPARGAALQRAGRQQRVAKAGEHYWQAGEAHVGSALPRG